MEILSMNVVVSAIVDPWVTTLSFVVALAMRIQATFLRYVKNFLMYKRDNKINIYYLNLIFQHIKAYFDVI